MLANLARNKKNGVLRVSSIAFFGTFLTLFLGVLLLVFALFTFTFTQTFSGLIILAYVAAFPNVGALLFAFIQGFGNQICNFDGKNKDILLTYILIGVVLSGPFTILAALSIDIRRNKVPKHEIKLEKNENSQNYKFPNSTFLIEIETKN